MKGNQTYKCDAIMDEFMALDKNEKLPLKVTLHLLNCEKCRTEVRLLTMAEKIAARTMVVSNTDNDFSRDNPVSLKNWILSGIIMIVFMLSFLILSSSLHSDSLTLAFALVFAFVITAYCALFVGVNLDFFVKKIENYESRHTTD